MTYGSTQDNHYIIRLERGEDIIESLKEFCEGHQLLNARFEGIGSIENPTLAHYKVSEKKYSEKKLEGAFEVTSLMGNIAFFEDEPMVHAHVTLGDENMQAYAGHLVNGTVSATMEVFLISFHTGFEKKYSEEIGLKLFELPEKVE